MPVSVVLIAKDCADSLAKTLASLRRSFVREGDEVLVLLTGETDGGATHQVALQYKARIEKRVDLSHDLLPYIEKWLPEQREKFLASHLVNGCILDFAEARQIAADLAKHDVQFWIDADDELEEDRPGMLRACVDKVFGDPASNRDAIFLDYHYSFDADGSVASILKRERITDRKIYHWVGRCHETNIPREWGNAKGAAYFSDIGSRLRHNRDAITDRTSDLRNYVILRKQHEEALAGKCDNDPRTVFYLGNAARGLSRHAEAVELYTELIARSGSPDDRFAAAYYCGQIYSSEGVRRPLRAIDWFQKCQVIKPDDPRGYFGMSRAYFQLGRWDACINWFKIGKLFPEPKQTLHTYSPLQIGLTPYVIAGCAYQELKQEDEACACVEHLIANYPNHPDTKMMQDRIGNFVAGRRLTESVKRVMANARPKTPAEGQQVGRAIVAHLDAVPDDLEEAGLAKLETADGRAGKDLIIWCGKAVEAWGPRSGESGIGGSEKAVVQMAPRLQKRGYRVTVYANVPREQRGLDSRSGVVWQHYGAMDLTRPRGTVIFWRAPEMLEMPIPAEKRIVWCHDVQHESRWTPERIALVDQVWVQSEFHAGTLGAARAALGGKLIIGRNGIDADLFRTAYKITAAADARDAKKCIFASSPDRGVLSAIRLFQEADVPGSTLDIYYGFNALFLKLAAQCDHRAIPDLGRDACMYDYMETVFDACDKDSRIAMKGRVGWEALAKAMCGAGVWLYPCKFDEISCMAAMEAQAAGCIPVASRQAALAETIFCGGNATVGDLRRALTDYPEFNRQAVHEEACKRFDYETLADDWVKLIG